MSDLRRATIADVSAIDAFLAQRAPVAMYPLSNLRAHGLDGAHSESMRFWANDDLTDVLGQARNGMVQPVFTSQNVAGIAAALAGRPIAGVVGTQAAVDNVLAAIELPAAALDRIEPHYELCLDRIIMPDVSGLTLSPFTAAMRDVLIRWRAAYYVEALDVSPRDAVPRATSFVERTLESPDYRVLMKERVPLSVTGFNAQTPDTVMIGGVYTPPELRGSAYASKALALNLKAARAQGVKRAVLSAANTTAAKAYERIGFEQVGNFRIVVLREPAVSHG